MDWMILLYLIGAGLMVWFILRMVRGNPESFTRTALSKSMFTLGILALILIGVILFSIMVLKN